VALTTEIRAGEMKMGAAPDVHAMRTTKVWANSLGISVELIPPPIEGRTGIT
jgi:hypothetical protein